MGCKKCGFAAVLKLRQNKSAVARVVGGYSRNKHGSVQHGDFSMNHPAQSTHSY